MTISESDIIRDENERSNLQRAITSTETAIAVSDPGTRRILEISVQGMRGRIAILDKTIEEAKVAHAAEVRAQAVAAAELAAKETALNAKERETYKGFLQESYFTKKDIGKLDEFYTHSYDRLSEGGKDEMSKRIHEGIKRGEFKESELPESVLEKDRKHLRKHSLDETVETNNRTSNVDKQSIAYNEVSNVDTANSAPVKAAQSTPNKSLDLSAVDLKGINLVTTNAEPTVAAMPDAMGSRGNGRV